MGILVEDLLLLARLDQQRPMAMDVLDLVSVAQDAVSAARVAHPDRQVSVAAPASAPVVGDQVRIRQVVDNLVTNALVYSPLDSPVDVAVVESAAGAELTVADRGPGIAPENRHRIFEPFQRLDPSRTRATGGVGLGLAIVAAIVRAHGGTVAVEDRPGGGSVFRVRLASASAQVGNGPGAGGGRTPVHLAGPGDVGPPGGSTGRVGGTAPPGSAGRGTGNSSDGLVGAAEGDSAVNGATPVEATHRR